MTYQDRLNEEREEGRIEGSLLARDCIMPFWSVLAAPLVVRQGRR